MRYFEVKKEELRGILMTARIYSDGEFIDEADETEARTLTTGYNVFEYDEQGMTKNVEFYPVNTDTEAWDNDEGAVLEQIKQDYSADKGWQNNNW